MDLENKNKYWNGWKNYLIRVYFYVQRGLALFNEFRYLIIAIFGVYITMKLSNPIWLVAMFIVSTVILIIAGWISVHHIGKVIDFLNIEFSTHFNRHVVNLQERTTAAVEEINKKLEDK